MSPLGRSNKVTVPGVRLFRACGPRELRQLTSNRFERFPPMDTSQSFFCPVTTLEYAEQIARDWHSTDAAYDHFGCVVRFTLRGEFMSRYAPHPIGGGGNAEYRIPAGDLRTLNENLMGRIDVLSEYSTGTRSR